MNTRTTIILLVVAVALGGGVLFMLNSEQKAAQEDTAVAASAKDLFDPKPASVVELHVDQADGGPRAFEQRKEEWYITQPVAAPAQKEVVQEEVRNLTDLQYTRKFDPGTADFPGDDLTGLKNPNVQVSFKDKDGMAHTLKVGNLRPMGNETYVARDNDPAVYVVNQNLLQRLAKPLNDFRSKRVGEVTYADISRVAVEGLQNYEFTKGERDTFTLEKPVRARVEVGKASDVMQAMCNLTAEDFVADNASNLRIYGLARPQLTVSITTEKKPPASQPATTQPASQPAATRPAETKTTTLLVGAKSGNLYFAKLQDEPAVFQISEATFKSLSTPLQDIRQRTLANLDLSKVTAVELDAAGRTARLVRDARRDWYMTGTYTGKVERPALEAMLQAVERTSAVAFEDGTNQLTYGFEKPRAHIALTVTGEVAPIEILVGSNTPSGEMTFVKNVSEGTVIVVKKSDADAMIVDPSSLLDRSVTTFAAGDVRKLEIANDGRTTVLDRGSDNVWKLDKPVQAPADAAAVQAVLADLSNLRARKVVGTGNGAEYGLDHPTVVATIHVRDKAAASRPATTQPASSEPAASQPAEKVFTLLVARNPKNDEVYARVPDRDWIYQLDPAVGVHLAAELRDRDVLKFDQEKVAAVRVPSDNNQTLEFDKQGDKWVYLSDPYLQIDAAKVKTYLTSLRGAKAEKFVAYSAKGNLADYGLNSPLCKAQITLDSGKVLNLVIAKPTSTGKYVATLVDSSTVFELPASFVQELRKPLSFFKGQ